MVSQTSPPEFKTIAKPITDEWVTTTWDQFIQLTEQPQYQNAKAYYHNHKMRIETMPTGSDHAKEHLTLIMIIMLFGIIHNIALDGRDNCTFRKVGQIEFQPDIAYYIGGNANQIPQGTRIIDIDQYPLPDLIIEVADTTLQDDLGEKRLQYEELGIPEYWVWNVQTRQVIAFAIGPDCSSRRLRSSEVLPGLELDLLETAMQRSWESGQSEVGQWLMQQWQSEQQTVR